MKIQLKLRADIRLAIATFLFLIPFVFFAQTVGVFYDNKVPQIQFAVQDVTKALKLKGFKVEVRELSKLKSDYLKMKVVVALESNKNVTKLLLAEGGKLPTGLGEQGYGLRTTSKNKLSYWVLGGDVNGTMYGALQIAENINFYNFSKTYNTEEKPSILKRGIKLNLPLDINSTTYFNMNNSTGSRFAITNVWDFSFWTTWFDTMARNRYNVLSVWNNHPFTSMIKMAEYPDVVMNDVYGYPNYYDENDKNGALIKKMSIDEKIIFWKKVMAYAKSRGFSFYLFNWNLFLYGAEGKYGLERDLKNTATVSYLRKSMYELFKTYPDLDGFGVTQGEAMGKYEESDKSEFLGATFGMGMADFAKDFPNRKLNFIHRWWFADFKSIKKNFAPLFKCPNVTFDMSFKYSMGHMYSSTTPDFFKEPDISALKEANLKTWFTIRNDDFFYHNWGSPDYAREYLKNMPGQDAWLKGFYIGSDGYNPTRTFFSKNSVTQGLLEVQRMWYINMIWGRLAYNPGLSDDVFINNIKLRYPEINSDSLFRAWNKVSAALPKVGEMFFNNFKIDQNWYPENCQSSKGFLKISDFAIAIPRKSSKLAGIPNTASNNLEGKISSFLVADKMEEDARSALALISSMKAPANSDLGVTLTTVEAMAYLTSYYAYKIRGATLNLSKKNSEAQEAMGVAYCWWIKYTNLMDANFKGMSCQRSATFTTWHQYDIEVLKEYTDLGGVGVPNCE